MTARDGDALKNEKWAASGSDGITTAGLTRSTGWPQSYSQTGGNNPEREVINQVFRELTAQAVESNQSGILAWDTSISYLHPAYVVGSDNRLYVSVRNNNGIDPTTDSNESDWKPVIATTDGTIDAPAPPPDASSTVKGIVELATATETQTGTDNVRAVTPAGLASRNATATRTGLVERATQAEADAGTDNVRFMTASLVKRRIEQAQTGFVRLTTGTSWTVPAWARMVFVEVIGGGGGGGGTGGIGGNYRYPGEGGLIARHFFLASSLGATVTYAIGAGGATDAAGGNTVFAGHAVGLGGRSAVIAITQHVNVATVVLDRVVATGQKGANGGYQGFVGETGLPTTVAGGAAGTDGTGTNNGGAGGAGTNSLNGLGSGGGGGGDGGDSGGNGGVGGAGGIPGGGGGGGGARRGPAPATDGAGGAGGRGEIRIWYW